MVSQGISENCMVSPDNATRLFAGYSQDVETGLYASRLRPGYNPTMGVWITKDPAEVGMNLYQYCDSNPLNRTDPMGLEGESTYSGDSADQSYHAYDDDYEVSSASDNLTVSGDTPSRWYQKYGKGSTLDLSRLTVLDMGKLVAGTNKAGTIFPGSTAPNVIEAAAKVVWEWFFGQADPKKRIEEFFNDNYDAAYNNQKWPERPGTSMGTEGTTRDGHSIVVDVVIVRPATSTLCDVLKAAISGAISPGQAVNSNGSYEGFLPETDFEKEYKWAVEQFTSATNPKTGSSKPRETAIRDASGRDFGAENTAQMVGGGLEGAKNEHLYGVQRARFVGWTKGSDAGWFLVNQGLDLKTGKWKDTSWPQGGRVTQPGVLMDWTGISVPGK